MADAVPAAPVVTAVMDVAAEPPAQLRVVGPDHIVPGPIGYVETWVRLLVGLAWVGVCSVAFVVVLFFCLPSRATRVKVGNVYGSFAGRGAAWLTGSRFVIKGEQYAVPSVPSIYVANHASVLDVFIGIWMSRTGTCGVAKKEIVYYPFLGQFFWLAGHLTIDRGNNARAVASLKHLVEFVTKNRLSIWIWPEGTRSKSGRLLPFKKGPFHLAVATKLPIVPVVIRGTHHAWPNRTFRLNRATVEIEFLPPISTSHWTQETMEAHIEELRSVYLTQLPADQLPIADDEITAPGRKAA